ncbi:hypothetical protein ACUW02_007079, partial [Pseudomonas aeruginosa]
IPLQNLDSADEPASAPVYPCRANSCLRKGNGGSAMQLPDWTYDLVLLALAFLLGALSVLGSSSPAAAFPY